MSANRVENAFTKAAEENRAALVIYLCAGDPTPAATVKLIEAIADAGADVIELGTPFSDPTADGPTIQRASERALAAGMNVPTLFSVVREVRRGPARDIPIVSFGYYNPILAYGEDAYLRDASEAGMDALLLVDLPLEELAAREAAALRAGLPLVPLVAPTSPPERVAKAGELASAFLYYVSMTGVTGSKSADLGDASERAAAIQKSTGRPVALGFGVKTPEDVRTVAKQTAGVVVGSAVVQQIEQADDVDDALRRVHALVSALRSATSR